MSLVWSISDDGSYVKAVTQDFIMEDKAAIFDLDHTLIKPLPRATGESTGFSLKPDDWMWCFSNVPSKIRNLYKEDHCIVIITNQLNLVGGTGTRYAWFREKMGNVIRHLNVPVLLLASVKRDHNRKPEPGLWFEHLNDIDIDQSFFCGDSAGRPDDFSNSDSEFTIRAGGKFRLPEDVFLILNENPEW